MKILHTVESYFPAVHGMSVVVAELSKRLAALGHSVVIATTHDEHRIYTNHNGAEIRSFKIRGNNVRGIQGIDAEIAAYRQLLTDPSFDIVANFAAEQWATDIALPILRDIPAKKVFIPTGFASLNNPAYGTYYERMSGYMKQYDMNIFLSHSYQDIHFAKDHGVDQAKCIVIPNGADEEEFKERKTVDIRKKLRIPHDHTLLLLIGNHTGHKGHAEAIRILKEGNIGPATLLIIGSIPKHAKRGLLCYARCVSAELMSIFWEKRIIVKRLGREETLAALEQADVFLFPSNIECSPLVIFESMAAGLPFAVTDVGNSAEIIEWSHGGILLPTKKSVSGYSFANIPASARALEELLADNTRLKRMGELGRASFQKHFTWEKIAWAYESAYKELLK